MQVTIWCRLFEAVGLIILPIDVASKSWTLTYYQTLELLWLVVRLG